MVSNPQSALPSLKTTANDRKQLPTTVNFPSPMRNHDLIEYLFMVIERGGSDLHISANSPPMGRINGVLTPVADEVLEINDLRELDLRCAEGKPARGAGAKVGARLCHPGGKPRPLPWQRLLRAGPHRGLLPLHPGADPELRDLGHGPTVEGFAELRDGLILVTGTSNRQDHHAQPR
jgi:twitching motility protein PilT